MSNQPTTESTATNFNRPGKWIYIVPLTGVKLTEAVKNEFCIKRVLLVDAEKLPRIRRRLGMRQRVSQLKQGISGSQFFELSNTYAATWYSGKLTTVEAECRRLIIDELSLLALSQLGYGKRRFGANPSIVNVRRFSTIDSLILCRDDNHRQWNSSVVGKIDILVLDSHWRKFQQDVFFFRLLDVINGRVEVADSWRKTLERSALMIGQSQCSTDIAHAFLWNMIALESLLTQQGDKYINVLPQRLEAFMGWVGFWQMDDYPSRIREVYKKRSKLVHGGHREEVTIADLLFTDDLLLNLLINLMHHLDIFRSKGAVIDFAERVECEHRLGITPRVRPKTLQFATRNYTEADFESI